MKYPLKTHKTGKFFPASGNCGTCGKPSDGKFICFSINASERIGDTDSFAPADFITSVSLMDHGVTDSGKPLTLFDDINDTFFCSTVCLRTFFNQVITDFENGRE
ncbi:hypothetical protein [Undibacterium pigrum]|uniref:Uncharacterized protein n=1 Tax=Undibacterium pigrum TaxID=401470 RepID=A0A318IJI1_9BURK|nr:hypothetical protein [Undibacterium pigrum]PXX33698.1 hypothetical protein DFR42_1302 [Undibacterium pigrum]